MAKKQRMLKIIISVLLLLVGVSIVSVQLTSYNLCSRSQVTHYSFTYPYQDGIFIRAINRTMFVGAYDTYLDGTLVYFCDGLNTKEKQFAIKDNDCRDNYRSMKLGVAYTSLYPDITITLNTDNLILEEKGTFCFGSRIA